MTITASTYTIHARVTPKSKTTLVEVIEVNPSNLSLKVKVRAAPEDGKANAEVIGMIADYFAIPKSKISLKSGYTSRNKVLIATGIDITKLAMQLPLC
jgi:uncharacterized protein YggU (UPF0235/DUF167 family)